MEATRASTRVEALIRELGETNADSTRGRFTLDLEKARAVLRTHRLTAPDRYLVPLARGLHAAGNVTVSVSAPDSAAMTSRGRADVHRGLVARLDTTSVTLGVPYRPMGRAEVIRLFSDASFGEGERTRFIAIGLDSALTFHPRECVFESGDRKGAGVRMSVNEGALEVESVQGGLAEGLQCRVVAKGGRSIWSRLFSGSEDGGPAQQVLMVALRYSRRSVVINGAPYFGEAIDARFGLFGGHWQAAVRLRPDPGAAALVHHVSDDVVVESEETRLLSPGVEVIFYSDLEPHPMGIEQIRRGEHYERRMLELRAALLGHIAAWVRSNLQATAQLDKGETLAQPHVGSVVSEIPEDDAAWLRATLSWAAQQEQHALVADLEHARMWQTLDGRQVSVAQMRSWPEIACIEVIPPHLRPIWFGDALLDPRGEALRGLRRLDGLSVTDGRSRLAVAERRAEKHRMWRSQPRVAKLDHDLYLATARVEHGRVSGEVGLRRTDDVFTRIALVVDGCALPDIVLRLPGISFEAVLAAELRLDADLVVDPNDPRLWDALCLMLQGALECWSKFAESRERAGHRSDFAQWVFAMLCALRQPSAWIEVLAALGAAEADREGLALRLCSGTDLKLAGARVLALARVDCVPRAHGEPVSLLDIELARRRGEVTPCVVAGGDGRIDGAGAGSGLTGDPSQLESLRSSAGASGSYGLALGAEAPAWNVRDAVLLTPQQRDAIARWWSLSPFVDVSEEFASREARARFESKPTSSLAVAVVHAVDAPLGTLLRGDIIALASPRFDELGPAQARTFVLEDDALADPSCAVDLQEGRLPIVRGRELAALELPAFAGRFRLVAGAVRRSVRLNRSYRALEEPSSSTYQGAAIAAAGSCVAAVIRAEAKSRRGGELGERAWVLACLGDLTRSRGLASAMLSLFLRLPHDLAVKEGERILRAFSTDPINADAWLERAAQEDAAPRAHQLCAALGVVEDTLPLEGDPWRWWQRSLIDCYGVALQERWLPFADGSLGSLRGLLDACDGPDQIASASTTRVGAGDVAGRVLLLDERESAAIASLLGIEELQDGDAILRQASKRAWLARRAMASRWSDSAVRPLSAVTLAGPGISGRVWIPRRRPARNGRARARLSSQGRSLGEIDVPARLDVELDVDVEDFELDAEDRIDVEVVERLRALVAVRLPALLHGLIEADAQRESEPDRLHLALAEAWAVEALLDADLNLPAGEQPGVVAQLLALPLVFDVDAQPVAVADWLARPDALTLPLRRGASIPDLLRELQDTQHALTEDDDVREQCSDGELRDREESSAPSYFISEDLYESLCSLRGTRSEPIQAIEAPGLPGEAQEAAQDIARRDLQISPARAAEVSQTLAELGGAQAGSAPVHSLAGGTSDRERRVAARRKLAEQLVRALLESNTYARSLQGRYERWIEAWLRAAAVPVAAEGDRQLVPSRVQIEDASTSLLARTQGTHATLVRGHPAIAFGLVDAAGAQAWSCMVAVALVAWDRGRSTDAPPDEGSHVVGDLTRGAASHSAADAPAREQHRRAHVVQARIDGLALALTEYLRRQRSKDLRRPVPRTEAPLKSS